MTVALEDGESRVSSDQRINFCLTSHLRTMTLSSIDQSVVANKIAIEITETVYGATKLNETILSIW